MYSGHAFPYAHTHFLILAITFLCVIHSHSSASERHRPIRTTLTLGISHLVSTRKPSHLSTQHPSKIHNKLYISLILDIKINPGPPSPKFPCGICNKAVTSRQCGVACDTCDTWHHTTCMNISSTDYESLHNISWHCISCSISLPTSSLPSSPSTNNSFSSLDISTSPTNNRLTSPPTTTTTAERHAHTHLSPFLTISLCRAGQYLSHPVFSVLCHVFSQLVFLHVSLYVVPPSLSRSASAPSPRDL